MSYVFRASNGQRSIVKMTQDRASSREDILDSLRQDILEALSGLVFKFELKLETVEVEGEKKTEPNDKTFAVAKKDVISDLKTKLEPEPQHEPQPEETRPAVTKTPNETAKPAENIPANHTVTKNSNDAVKPAERVPVKPTLTKKSDEPMKPAEEKLAKPEVAPEVADKSLERRKPAFIDAILDPVVTQRTNLETKSRDAQKSKNELTRGSVKIGGIIETLVVGFGGTDEEPIYYVPYDNDKFMHINSLLQDQGPNIESTPLLPSVQVNDIVLAKSKEDNMWYRSVIEKVNVENAEIYFFDWGVREVLELDRVRGLDQPELSPKVNPVAVIKVDIANKPGPLVNRFVNDNERLPMKVDSYDGETDTYTVTLID